MLQPEKKKRSLLDEAEELTENFNAVFEEFEF